MKLTKKTNTIILWTVFVIGLILVAIIKDAHTGTAIFLMITFIESALFVYMYGTRSSWRDNDASSALFWSILTYCLLSAHILVSFLWAPYYALRDDIRQILYLFLVVADLNIFLTMVRLQQQTAYEQDELDSM